MDPDKLISDIPFYTLLKLSQYLDVGTSKMNWRALIATIPDQIYGLVCMQVLVLCVPKEKT